MNAKSFRPLLLGGVLAIGYPAASFAGAFAGPFAGVTVQFAPPALAYDAQPPCPDVGYLWTPGYWAYSQDQAQYYWVSGRWVLAPQPGFLWTPGYWSEGAGYGYLWNAGYWGPHVGFYGGINYGFGYFGVGFQGGYWRDRAFFYNRAVTNIDNRHITNVYNQTIVNNRAYNSRVSFNGSQGVHARPTAADRLSAREPHRGMTDMQRRDLATVATQGHNGANNGHVARAVVNSNMVPISTRPPSSTRPAARYDSHPAMHFPSRQSVPQDYARAQPQDSARARLAQSTLPNRHVNYSIGPVSRAPRQAEFKAPPIANVRPNPTAAPKRASPPLESARHVNLGPPAQEHRKA